MVEYVLINAFNAIEAFAGRAWNFVTDIDPRLIGVLVLVVLILAWMTRPRTRM